MIKHGNGIAGVGGGEISEMKERGRTGRKELMEMRGGGKKGLGKGRGGRKLGKERVVKIKTLSTTGPWKF